MAAMTSRKRLAPPPQQGVNGTANRGGLRPGSYSKMADDEDYMSDKFLFDAPKNNRGQSGLLPDRIVKQRKKEEEHKEKNEKNRIKPMRVREAEHREQGLSAAIGSSNVGFALLQKMGYKQGMGLGKEGTGRAEPITVSVKTGRGGLGRDAMLKRQREIKEDLRSEFARKRVKVEQKQRENFRTHMSNKFVERQIKSDLYKSQKACEQLDKSKDLPCVELWFWPEVEKTEDEEETEVKEEEDEEEEEEEEELLPGEKLGKLTEYLREIHYYCIWCGTKYDDEQDITSNCPGNTAEDHE